MRYVNRMIVIKHMAHSIVQNTVATKHVTIIYLPRVAVC